MLQETTTVHQDGTTNNPKFSKKKKIFGKILGRLMIKMNNVRKKNDKSKKCQVEESINNKYSNNPSGPEMDQNPFASSSTKKSTTSPSPVITISQPIASTSVTSFSDNELELTIDASSKSTSLFIFNNDNNSVLKHKTSTTSENLTIDSSVLNSDEMTLSHDGQAKPKIKKGRKTFSFRNWRNNNHSNTTLNSSIESTNNEQNDSAYETEPEPENCCLKKREKKVKSQETKIIKKTKLKTLSPKDKEYIEVKRHFLVGLPNKKIHGIVQLQMPTKLVEAHEQFKKQVAQKNSLSESKICHKMFHGTKTALICKPQHFVNNKCALFCKFGCGVCGIIQEGNRKKYSHYTQRMWFANNSATSLSYCSGTNMKAMFLVDVVSTSPNTILIIEDDEATIPRYLIVFQ